MGCVNSSTSRTVRQADTATKNRPRFMYANSIATANATAAATGDWVAERIAGKVMTAKVT